MAMPSMYTCESMAFEAGKIEGWKCLHLIMGNVEASEVNIAAVILSNYSFARR